MKKIFLTLLPLLVICASMMAQQVITGKVLDNNGQPLPVAHDDCFPIEEALA